VYVLPSVSLSVRCVERMTDSDRKNLLIDIENEVIEESGYSSYVGHEHIPVRTDRSWLSALDWLVCL